MIKHKIKKLKWRWTQAHKRLEDNQPKQKDETAWIYNIF